MSQTTCLSLAPNLRCITLNQLQSEVLIIPPIIEFIVCIFLIFSKRASDRDRRFHALLAADGILYFIWTLLDLLSHVVPAVRNSSSIFKSLDIFLGSVSFTPLILYSLYLYRLSRRDFIPDLPQRHQALPFYSLAMFMVLVVAFNEVASFADVTIESSSTGEPFSISFTPGQDPSWLPWSQLSLATFTTIQIIFFLLAFYRLGKALLDQRRIEITHSDAHHFLNGIVWITVGLQLGVIETLAGFAQGDFTVALARRILRLVSRTVLIVGVLKGLDSLENFENLANELRGTSQFSKRVSRFFGINSRSIVHHQASQSEFCPLPELGLSLDEKPRNDQRVTVHYEKGQAPFLHIRFSGLDFPSQAVLADGVRTRRGSELISFIDTRASHKASSVSASLLVTPETLRAESAKPAMWNESTDWYPPPMIGHTSRRESGGTISDNLSVVRDLERRFPLPPRVTGRYRGSILGQRYEEDLFPVVGVSRESSLSKNDGTQRSTEAGSSSGLGSTSGSIKRKPAPPLLAKPAYALGSRPLSTWGGLAQNSVQYPTASPTTPTSPWIGATTRNPSMPPSGETQSPKSTSRMTPRNLLKRVSKAVSDTSIHSAEWLASARSHPSSQSQLTPANIEMYRNGVTVSPSPRRMSDGPSPMAARAGGTPIHEYTRKSADDTRNMGPGAPRQCWTYNGHTDTNPYPGGG